MIAHRKGYRPNIGHCQACGQPTHMDLLDAKPSRPNGADYDRLECWECYGPGYNTARAGQNRPESSVMCATMRARAVS